MSELNNKQKSVVPYSIGLPDEYVLKIEKEPIRIFKPNKSPRGFTKVLSALFRFILITLLFAIIFLCVYFCLLRTLNRKDKEKNESGVDINNVVGNNSAETSIADTNENDIPVSAIEYEGELNLIDESKTGVNLIDYLEEEYQLHSLMSADKDIRVIIVHSHTSEYVSENLSVLDAGEVLAQLLNSAGINTLHCTALHDESGRIGAYNNMEKSIHNALEEHKKCVLVVDLHNSDIDEQVTFTVGTDSSFAWKENLRLAAALSVEMGEYNTTVRLLPNTLGQDNGLLTVNIGIGGEHNTDEEGRRLVSAVFTGILGLCNTNPSA